MVSSQITRRASSQKADTVMGLLEAVDRGSFDFGIVVCALACRLRKSVHYLRFLVTLMKFLVKYNIFFNIIIITYQCKVQISSTVLLASKRYMH